MLSIAIRIGITSDVRGRLEEAKQDVLAHWTLGHAPILKLSHWPVCTVTDKEDSGKITRLRERVSTRLSTRQLSDDAINWKMTMSEGRGSAPFFDRYHAVYSTVIAFIRKTSNRDV